MVLVAATSPVLAAAADQIRTRVAGYRDLGAAFKAANDALRSPQPQLAVVQQSAARIRVAARNQYAWFPAGSGPQRGVKTGARVEIWARARDFRTAQDAFARQADSYQRVAAGGDIAAIRLEARRLGAACKGCHDTFRLSDD
jgi:cytochrome c556